jgi:hypothetical protein
MLSSFTGSFQAGKRAGLIEPFTADILQDNLLAHFESSFTDSYPGSGTQWFDITDTGYVATLEDNTYYSPESNGVFVLDGVDDAISIPHTSVLRGTLNGSLTIQTWINVNSFNDKDRIFEKFGTDGYGLQIRSGNVLALEMNGLTSSNVFVSDTNALPINQWVLVTAVINWNGRAAKPSRVYVNNVQFISGANTESSLGTNTAPLLINAGKQTSREPISKVGAVYIYTKELSALEIENNFEATKLRFGL